ncbi:metalloregulator ArsR/SmtB family transcription factor [uncultured Rhodoferax sp.]|uniref:ArsR/SmtB family transcription factor n=1 Tax=uncultured Rhodoferax sp. TaxID=223188 RepID=UPI0025CE639D|nr:metalloregulator ArsR/SmtB family transcription factor [uncultured Rhodoferax sp.]
MDAIQTVKALGALAHETRLSVFRMLVQAGPEGLTPSVIAETLEMPAPPLSFHLKELTQAGLIVARPEGRKIHYSANFTAMNELVGYLTENCCGGQVCEVDATGAACC